jgi:hypothetical protein
MLKDMLSDAVSLNNILVWELNLKYKSVTSVSPETAFEKMVAYA